MNTAARTRRRLRFVWRAYFSVADRDASRRYSLGRRADLERRPDRKTYSVSFIDSGKLTEQFTHLVIRFTDKTLDEIKASPHAKMGTAGLKPPGSDLYRSNQQLLRRELHDNGELRALGDLYAPQRPGYFDVFIAAQAQQADLRP